MKNLKKTKNQSVRRAGTFLDFWFVIRTSSSQKTFIHLFLFSYITLIYQSNLLSAQLAVQLCLICWCIIVKRFLPCWYYKKHLRTFTHSNMHILLPTERWLTPAAHSFHVNNVLFSHTKHYLPFWQGAWTCYWELFTLFSNFLFYLLQFLKGSWALTVFVEMKNGTECCAMFEAFLKVCTDCFLNLSILASLYTIQDQNVKCCLKSYFLC